MQKFNITKKIVSFLSIGILASLASCTDSMKENSLNHESSGVPEKIETVLKVGEVKDESFQVNEKIDFQPSNQTSHLAKAGVEVSASNSVSIGLVPIEVGDCLDEMWLYMDDEDFYNASYISINGAEKGTVGGFTSRTKVTYCTKYVTSLTRLSYDYAVLRGAYDNGCPENGYEFSRRFDNEDWYNRNRMLALGTGGAVTSSGNSTWTFCFVPKIAGGPSYPPHWDAYMIFAGLDAPVTWRGVVYTDDEDNRNNNSWQTSHSGYTSRMQAIISSGKNTKMRFASNKEPNIVVKTEAVISPNPATPVEKDDDEYGDCVLQCIEEHNNDDAYPKDYEKKDDCVKICGNVYG